MRAAGHAVESTCRVLTEHGCKVAARTYRSWKQDNRPIATRTMSDAVITDALLAVQGTPEGLYGRRKMTHWLRRQGHEVAFCTVDRLMRRTDAAPEPPRSADDPLQRVRIRRRQRRAHRERHEAGSGRQVAEADAGSSRPDKGVRPRGA